MISSFGRKEDHGRLYIVGVYVAESIKLNQLAAPQALLELFVMIKFLYF